MVSATTPRSSPPSDVEVDLVAQARAEALERARGVVAAAVEAAVDQLPGSARRAGPEQRRHRERRAGDGEVGLLGERAERELKQQHARRGTRRRASR